MKEKNKNFKSILCMLISMGIGAGSVYLANYKKIDFINRYPLLIEADRFTKETLEIKTPENPESAAVLAAYYSLFDDKYTYIEKSMSPYSKEYALDKINNSYIAKENGFRVQYNEKDEPYFSAVVESMNADTQGIKIGDIIKEVDGLEVTEFRHAIRVVGNKDEMVNIVVERDGKEVLIEFVRILDMNSINGLYYKSYGDVLYVSVEHMTEGASNHFLSTLNENDFKSLIIDLRGNSGGYTKAAVEIADLFIGESETIMHANNGDEEVYMTQNEISFEVPIVILINEKTASAAEILTSLLKQYGDATLVGMNTFGKGIYQTKAIVYNETLRYTEGYYTVGDWENYHGVGIKPDVEIDMDSDYIGTDKDIQLEKALELAK